MNFLSNKPFTFIADRYEEWSGGMCLSQGPVEAEITVTVNMRGLHVVVKGADSLRMYKEADYPFTDQSGDLGDRIQYVSQNIAFNPMAPIVFHIFYENRTINYIRFAMTSPDRIIEFYGKAISFDGVERIELVPGKRLPSFKESFREEIADLYRALLKENTVTLAVIDHQMACVFFSLKKYLTLLAMVKDPDGILKDQVFKDVSSSISEFFPIFLNDAVNDPREWFDKVSARPQFGELIVEYYVAQLDDGEEIDCYRLVQALESL